MNVILDNWLIATMFKQDCNIRERWQSNDFDWNTGKMVGPFIVPEGVKWTSRRYVEFLKYCFHFEI